MQERLSVSVSECALPVERHQLAWACVQLKKIVMKMKMSVYGVVCASEFARVGVQGEVQVAVQVFFLLVAKFVELE